MSQTREYINALIKYCTGCTDFAKSEIGVPLYNKRGQALEYWIWKQLFLKRPERFYLNHRFFCCYFLCDHATLLLFTLFLCGVFLFFLCVFV